jgi:hypothetical protein
MLFWSIITKKTRHQGDKMSETIMRAGLDGSGYAEGARVITKANLDIMESTNRAQASMLRVGASSISGYGAAKNALLSLHGPARETGQLMERIEDRIIRIGATLAVFRTFREAVGLVKMALKEAFDFMALIENSTLGIASSFLLQGDYVDKTTGKILEMDKALVLARSDSIETIERLKIANMATIATLDELVKIYQIALPVAMKKGFSREQVENFVTSVTQMAGAVDMPMQQVGTNIRAILGQGPLGNRSRLAAILGIDTLKQIQQQFKNDGPGFYAAVMDLLKPFTLMGVETQKTFKGLVSNVTDIAKQGLEFTFSPMFEMVKAELMKLQNSVIVFDNVAKTRTWNKDFVAKCREVGTVIKEMFQEIINAIQWFRKYGMTILETIKYLIQYKFIMMSIEAIITIYNKLNFGSIGILLAKNQALAVLGSTEAKGLSVQAQKIALTEREIQQEAIRRTTLIASTQAQEAAIIANKQALAFKIGIAELAYTGSRKQTASALAVQGETAAQASVYNAQIARRNELYVSGIAAKARAAEQEAQMAMLRRAYVENDMRNTLAQIEAEKVRVLAMTDSFAKQRAMIALNNEARNQEWVGINKIIVADHEQAIADEKLAIAKGHLATAITDINALEMQAMNTKARYVSATGAAIKAQQAEAASLAELTRLKIAAIEADVAAEAAAIRYNAAILKSGAAEALVSAAQLRKVQTSFYALGPTARNVVASGASTALQGGVVATQQTLLVTNAYNEALKINAARTAAASLGARALATTTKILGGVFTLVGGWIGVITIAIMAALWAWNKYGDAVEKAKKKMQEANQSFIDGTKNIKAQIEQIEATERLQKNVSTSLEQKAKDKLAIALGGAYEEYQDKVVRIATITKQIDSTQSSLNEKLKSRNEFTRRNIGDEAEKLVLLKHEKELLVKSTEERAKAALKLKELQDKNQFVAKEETPGVPQENFAKDRTLLQAYISYMNSYYKDLLAMQKAYSESSQIDIDERYRKAEISQKDHIALTISNQQEQTRIELGYLQEQKAMYERERTWWIEKTHGAKELVTNKDGSLKRPEELNINAPDSKATKQERDNYKNRIDQVKEYYNLSRQIAGVEHEESMLRIKDIDAVKKAQIDLVKHAEEILKSQENINIELLNSYGNEIAGFEAYLNSDTYKDIAVKMANDLKAAKATLDAGPLPEERRNIALSELDNAQKVIDAENEKNRLKREGLLLSKEHLLLQTHAGVLAAQGDEIGALRIANQIELEQLAHSKQKMDATEYQALLEDTIAKQTLQMNRTILESSASYYDQITGFAQESYDIKMELLDLELAKMRSIGIEEAAIAKFRADEEKRAYIQMGRDSDDWTKGVRAGLKQIALDNITWGEVTYQTSQTTYKAMSDMFSNIFMDAWEGKLKKAGEYFQTFAQSIMKTFFDMLAQMAAKALMKSIFGTGDNGSGLFGLFSGLLGGLRFGGGGGGGAQPMGPVAGTPVVWTHTGGVPGVDSIMTSMVNRMAYAGAPKFHSGFASDEFPAVLKRSEGVFTAGQMRALGLAINSKNNSSGNSGNQLTVNVPITVDSNNKAMISELRQEVEKKVVEVIRKHS